MGVASPRSYAVRRPNSSSTAQARAWRPAGDLAHDAARLQLIERHAHRLIRSAEGPTLGSVSRARRTHRDLGFWLPETVETDATGRFRVVAPSPGESFLWVRSPSGRYAPMRTDLPEAVDSDVQGKGRLAGKSTVFTMRRDGHRTDFDAGVRID